MMHYSIKGISYLEQAAKDRLQKADFEEVQRLIALNQLIRFGVCTCHCHFSNSVFHSAEPCCGNAKLTG